MNICSQRNSSSEWFVISPYQTYSAIWSTVHNAEFAVLQNRITSALRNIPDNNKLNFTAYLENKADAQFQLNDFGEHPLPFLQFGINIYGPKESGKIVGKILSREKIFLQEPLHLEEYIEYDNPHIFKGLTSHYVAPLDPNPSMSAPKEVARARKTQVDFVLQDLHHVDDLPPTTPDPRIRTTLREYEISNSE